jgi:hypothetical protein
VSATPTSLATAGTRWENCARAKTGRDRATVGAFDLLQVRLDVARTRRVRAPGTGQAVGEALYLKLRPHDEPAEGVLVAWGVTLEGRKVLLGLRLGSRESYDNWLAFGATWQAAGRARRPWSWPTAPGLWKAVRELWPTAEEQRCTVRHADWRVMPTSA